MGPENKVRGILSLSSASLALLQSVVSASGTQADKVMGDAGTALKNGDISSKASNLVLHHQEMIQLYADHSSHASHSSHSSHSSHYSGVSGADYSTAPSTPAPAAPQPTYPSYSQPLPRSPAATTVSKTNTVSQTSSSSGVTTNALAAVPSAQEDADLLTFLKKRAAEGSSDAQFALADYYLKGKGGVKQDEEAGKLLLEMSASQGNTFAKEKLEQMKGPGKDATKPNK